MGLLAFNPSWFFFVFFSKHSFSPETGYFVHFSVSLFLLGFFHFSFFTLCLSLSISISLSWFLFFPSMFSCFLSLFFAVISCLVSLLLFHEKKSTSNMTLERFLFINYFCFWGGFLFVLSCESLFLFFICLFFQLCVFVNINVFIFQRRPFLKHQVLFFALCKVIVFVKGRF